MKKYIILLSLSMLKFSYAQEKPITDNTNCNPSIAVDSTEKITVEQEIVIPIEEMNEQEIADKIKEYKAKIYVDGLKTPENIQYLLDLEKATKKQEDANYFKISSSQVYNDILLLDAQIDKSVINCKTWAKDQPKYKDLLFSISDKVFHSKNQQMALFNKYKSNSMDLSLEERLNYFKTVKNNLETLNSNIENGLSIIKQTESSKPRSSTY